LHQDYQTVSETGRETTFTVSLDGGIPLDEPVSASFLLLPGTATPGEDYEEVREARFTSPAGEMETRFQIKLIDDDEVETDETFSVVLYDSSHPDIRFRDSLVQVNIDSDDRLEVIPTDQPFGVALGEWKPVALSEIEIRSDFHDLATNGDIYLAVGERGATIISRDGKNWEVGTLLPGNPNARALTWTGHRFIVVGEQGRILTSSDGIEWAIEKSNTPVTLNDITWTGDQAVAVGNEGTILTSSEGIEWLPVLPKTDKDILSVAWAERQSILIAVGEMGTCLLSEDGAEWAAHDTGSRQQLNAVIPAGDRITLCGAFSTILETRDRGLTWQRISAWEFRTQLYGGVYTGTETVFIGTDGALCSNFDSDGSWKERKSGTRKTLRSIISTPRGFLAVGDGGTLLSATAVDRWQSLNTGTLTYHDATWTGRHFVAVGEMGMILTSPNGTDWQTRDSGVDAILHSVTHGNGLVVAVGTGGPDGRDAIIVTSADDGETWQSRNPGATHWLYRVQWTGSLFSAVGSKGLILFSRDGLHWEKADSPTDQRLFGVTSNPEGQVVAVGEGGLTMTSFDGRNWNVEETGLTSRLYDVVWLGSRFMAVGTGDTAVISNDGRNWSPIAWQEAIESEPRKAIGDFHSVVQIGNRVLMGGKAGAIVATAGGETFTTSYLNHKTEDQTVRKLEFGGNAAIAVGQGGIFFSETPRASLGYDHWKTAFDLHGEEAALSASNNPDGLSNHLAFAFGLDPNRGLPEAGSLLQISRTGPDQAIEFPEPPAHHDLTFILENSSDLKSWKKAAHRWAGETEWIRFEPRKPFSLLNPPREYKIERSTTAGGSPILRFKDNQPLWWDGSRGKRKTLYYRIRMATP
ncbi:MAG: Calx-beta domain-containing protein, partial [Verrucomicrobiota bacterium]